MVKKFTDFTDLGAVQEGDALVGTRDNVNIQVNFDTGVKDSFGNYLIGWESGGSGSTNYIKWFNAVSGSPVLITAVGLDSDVGIKIAPKNSGDFVTETSGDGSFIHTSIGVGGFEVNTGGYLKFNDTQPFKYVSNDVTLADDSSIDLVTEHAVKTYVDNSSSALASLTYITDTDETADLPNSFQLAATANQTTVNNGIVGLSSTIVTPGTFNIGGAGATVTSISTDGTLGSNSDALLSTQKAIKTYADSVGGGAVTLTNAGVASGTQSAVNDGTGPSLAIKGFVGANGITTSSDSTDVTVGITASSSSAGKMLRATGSTWDASTSTFANTYNQYDILMATSANTVTGFAKAQNSVLTTDLLSVPAWTHLGNFQFLGGALNGLKPYIISVGNGMDATYNSGTTPGVITVELSAPVSIANGGTNTTSAIGANGTLARSDGTKYTFTTATYPDTAGTAGNVMTSDGTNWNSTAAAVVPLTFNTVTGSTQSMAVNNCYYSTYAGTCVMTLPASATVGVEVEVITDSSHFIQIAQNSGQLIYFGALGGVSQVTTTGVGGSLTTTAPNTVLRLKCIVTNTTWIVLYASNSVNGV